MPHGKVSQPASEVFQGPSLESSISGAEFSRWYWLKTELAVFAGSHRLSTTGGKEQLAERIVAFLGGKDQPATLVRSFTLMPTCASSSPRQMEPPP